MNIAAITKNEIMQDIPITHRNSKGIWEDAGFEKMPDLEQDIREARQELQEKILERAKNLFE